MDLCIKKICLVGSRKYQDCLIICFFHVIKSNVKVMSSWPQVAVLKEHFSPYGDLSAVEVEDPVANEGSNHNLEKTENCGAQVSFTMRSCAEKAFINGKSWKGHALQFTWLSRSKSNNDDCISKSSSLERRKSEEGEKISTEGDC